MKESALFPNRPTRPLVARAQSVLGMTHRQFGNALGASERTSLRWARHSSVVSVEQLRTLARLVYPRDAALAESIAEAASETLVSLGIVAPPAPAPVPPARLAASFVAELVVYAAADALGASPTTAKGAVLAAFARARELGVSVEEVERALGES